MDVEHNESMSIKAYQKQMFAQMQHGIRIVKRLYFKLHETVCYLQIVEREMSKAVPPRMSSAADRLN